MSFITDHKVKFDNLRVSLEMKNRDQLRRTANGGNSILFTYPPDEEALYISKAMELLPESDYQFINISSLFVNFIDEMGWEDFADYYKDFSVTPHLIFNSNDETPDLMDGIITAIKQADADGKTPILIRTGTLHGTGIENVNIMEHPAVMSLKKPLVVFYPARMDGDNLLFMNFKPASKYRCAVIK